MPTDAALKQGLVLDKVVLVGRNLDEYARYFALDLVLDADAAALDSVRAHCRAQLASYKIPSRLNIVSELPRTAVTGKIRREVIAV